MKFMAPLAIGKLGDDIVEFYSDRYISDGSPAIMAMTEDGEMWGMITVNLSEYRMRPHHGWIFLNHDCIPYKDAIIRMIGTGETLPIEYGFANSIAIKLKPEIAERLIGWEPEEE